MFTKSEQILLISLIIERLRLFLAGRSVIRLLDSPNLMGMVSNTSGLADIAALVGWRVYNMHRFTQKFLISDQEYRILLQHPFMSIGHSYDTKNSTCHALERNLWLINRNRVFPSLLDRMIRTLPEDKAYMHHA